MRTASLRGRDIQNRRKVVSYGKGREALDLPTVEERKIRQDKIINFKSLKNHH